MAINKEYNSNRFVKTGGTSSQYLMADGSVRSGIANEVIGTDDNIAYGGATVLGNINFTDGVATSHASRTLTLAQLGYTGATNANYITNNNQLSNGAGYITQTLSAENVEDIMGAAWENGTGTTFNYNDVTGSLSIDSTYTPYVHPTFAGDDISVVSGTLTGALVFSGINMNVTTNTEGHVTTAFGNVSTRVLTLADLGYTGDGGANNYVHPTYNGDDMGIDTGALTGAVVISDIDLNVSTDTLGHVTDANATVATRTLTLANLGYTGATNANYITNNNQLTNGAGYAVGTISTSESTSTIVKRTTSGYINSQYFNGTGTFSTSGSGSGMGIFTGTNGTDTYGRSYTAAAARTLLNVADGANNYSHPAYASTNINTSGATIVDIITTNSTGHVTALGTRTLTLADLGYTGNTGGGVASIIPSTTDGKEGIEITNGSSATVTVGLDLDLIDSNILDLTHIIGVDDTGKNIKSEKSQFFAYSEQIVHQITGNASTTTFAVWHDLGFDAHIQIFDWNASSSYYKEQVYPKVEHTSASNVQVTFNTAPVTGQNYRVLMNKINSRNV
tara:strand:- start:2932 stop:4617 length:1686 start_codon:yes stop_codon:yes gene_type:complete